jgi:hypothetical protein
MVMDGPWPPPAAANRARTHWQLAIGREDDGLGLGKKNASGFFLSIHRHRQVVLF